MSASYKPNGAGQAGLESLERQVADLIVTTLNLEIHASDLAFDQALFGDEGLGLDSIDALEIALVIEHRYGIKIGAEDEQNDKRFACVRSLAAFIQEARAAKPEMALEASDPGHPLK